MYATEFPVSTFMMVAWALCLVVAVYFFVRLLNFLLRKSRRAFLVSTFILLLLAGAAVHLVVLSLSSHTVTSGNWVQLVLVSLVAGLEMFIGHTVIFDDIIAAVVFHMPGLLLVYLTVFVLILSFSFVMVFQILPRRLRDRFWLLSHARQSSISRKNHVFIGITPSAKLLARSILSETWEGEQGELIFVDSPAKEGVQTEISLGDIFASIVSRRKEVGLDEELGSDRFVLLKGERPAPGGEEDLCAALGLGRLRAWFHNPHTSVYFLGDPADNDDLLDRLLADPGVQAKVFSLTDQTSGFHAVYSAARGRVRLIDTHLLAVQQIKFQKPELHPIRFVEMAAGADGEPLGYVCSGFHALHVGFRQTGQEALRFLYEFGSFVGKDRCQVPTSFDIFDDQLEERRGNFLNRYPGMKGDASLVWNEGKVGSTAFWDRFSEIADTLNYVVVSTGDPQRNIDLGVRLLETAARGGKDLSRFVILVRVAVLDERTREILSFFNTSYHPDGEPVLRPFGVDSEIWNIPSISGKGLKEQASRFYAEYQQAIGGNETWETRRQKLSGGTGAERMRNMLQLLRQQGQDLSRSAYMPTIRTLAGGKLREAAQRIPSSYEGAHYPESGADAEHLEYLAAQEQLRWQKSLRAAGYSEGAEPDELRMRMYHLQPYDQVKEPKWKHFDWIVVKTALADHMNG